MKIIQNNNKSNRQKCRKCSSILEVDYNDIEYSEYIGYPYFICPCCGEKNIYIDMEEVLRSFDKNCHKFFN